MKITFAVVFGTKVSCILNFDCKIYLIEVKIHIFSILAVDYRIDPLAMEIHLGCAEKIMLHRQGKMYYYNDR